MDKITITVPEAMNTYVRSRIADGQYGNVSEFFRDLVRQDQARQKQAIDELRDIIDRAEASGISSRSFREIVEDARKEVLGGNSEN